MLNLRARASLAKNVIVRSYKPDDETKIVDFLNICYGEWGTIQKWQFLYSGYPTFNKDDVVILEVDDEIIGHGGTHFRDLVVGKRRLHTTTLSDAAIHPHYRGRGLYTKLVDMRLKRAKSKGACLALAWHLRGSNAYKHNKKTGFIEVNQSPVYMKIIRPKKVLKAGLSDLLHKNQRLRWTLQDLQDDLCFRVRGAEFSIAELLGRADNKLTKDRRGVTIALDEISLLTMTNFRKMNRLERIGNLVLLILLGRMKIRFSSLKVLLNLARKGVAIFASI